MNKNPEKLNSPTRMSRQRTVVLQQARLLDHPSADQVYQRVRQLMPRISLGTVYRNLEMLSAMGMLNRLDFCDCRRFDKTVVSHNHARCVGCGKVCDVELAHPVELEKIIAPEGFRPLSCLVEVAGLCNQCQAAVSQDDSQSAE